MNRDVEIRRRTAPLDPETAWEVESLLLKIFEYGDYSFRSALLGDYSETLDCTFFLARQRGQLVGAAGCLTGRLNPAISLLGPVGVGAEHCGNKVGSMLVKSAIDELNDRDCKAIYLGTPDQNGVANFYEKLGFQKHCGIVMRRLLCSEADFYDSFNAAKTEIRRALWGDFPAVCILATVPASFYTFDLPRDVFSSKYVEPTRFLSIFPRMMKEYAKQGGFANVLVTNHNQAVVGIAGLTRLPSAAQRHVAEVDFFVHDNFIEQAEYLVRATLEQTKAMDIQNIMCSCLGGDHLERTVIENVGFKQIAVLPDGALIHTRYEEILVYQLGDPAHEKD